MKDWVWWIILLPASIFALITGNLLGELLCSLEHLFWGNNGGLEDLFNTYILNPFQTNTISSFAFVFTGYFLAPKHKQTVGLIMMIILLCVGSISMFVVNFIDIDYMKNIGIIFAMIGAVIGYLYAKSKIHEV